MRGMSAEEALFEVDNFLSRAIMAGLPAVTVIHGKGTGVLRNAVQQHLRKNKRVKSVRSGVYGEGEQGVTIVLITHYMEEAAQAQRVVVIDGGEVIMDNVPKKIFSNVETMKNLGLDVPQVTELCWELKRAGYAISTEIIHEDECVQKLYEMLK